MYYSLTQTALNTYTNISEQLFNTYNVKKEQLRKYTAIKLNEITEDLYNAGSILEKALLDGAGHINAFVNSHLIEISFVLTSFFTFKFSPIKFFIALFPTMILVDQKNVNSETPYITKKDLMINIAGAVGLLVYMYTPPIFIPLTILGLSPLLSGYTSGKAILTAYAKLSQDIA